MTARVDLLHRGGCSAVRSEGDLRHAGGATHVHLRAVHLGPGQLLLVRRELLRAALRCTG
ncbi:MAG TPA: hypothetical protein VFX33_00785 [Actinomycetales bacterium]|nr:hypothetical protein [Actinomycetales bacterium]